MLHIKLAQFAVRGALPPRRSESPTCATDNKPSCVLHLLGWFIGSRGFCSLERMPEFWVLQLQCSCLENPRDRGAWWAAVYGVAESRPRLKWLSSSGSRVILINMYTNINIYCKKKNKIRALFTLSYVQECKKSTVQTNCLLSLTKRTNF